MAANVLPHHNLNPYQTSKQQSHLVLFKAGHQEIIQLIPLTPTALQVLLCLVSHLNGSGYARFPLDELTRYVGKSRSYVSQAIGELARLGYLKKKKNSEYWLNPRLFRPALLEW